MAHKPSLPRNVGSEDAVRPDWRMSRPLRTASRAVAEALFLDHDPPESPTGDAAHVEWVLDEVETFLAHAGGRARAAFSASVLALTTLAPPLIGAAPPLSRLGPRDRARAIHKFEATPLGLAVLGAKGILCIHHFEAPAKRAAIGIDDRCLVPRTSP